jgi:hypothetical protein
MDEESRSLTPVEIRSLVAGAKDIVTRLERPGMPEDGLCGHFGISFYDKESSVTVDVDHHGRLLLRFQIKHPVPDRSWAKVQLALIQAFECQVWDAPDHRVEGKDQANAWITLCRYAPLSLRKALHNYKELDDVFNHEKNAPRYEAFRGWFDGK